MKSLKLILIFFCILLSKTYCQKQHKISIYIEGEFVQTLYDKASGNNPWGIGLGAEAYFNNQARIQPAMELTAATYLEDDKVLILNTNGSVIDRINNMTNLLAGVNIHLNKKVNLSLLAGPSLINSQVHFSLKPSIALYFSKKQKTIGKISYINVFNRTHDPNKDYGSLNVSVCVSLFNK